jgi:hypothetical protein
MILSDPAGPSGHAVLAGLHTPRARTSGAPITSRASCRLPRYADTSPAFIAGYENGYALANSPNG